jgi:hypothetical protein
MEKKMKTDVRFLRPLVEQILLDPNLYQWTIQGFGMLRTYVGPPDNPSQFRLNIWDSRFMVPDVSTIHDHPWHFESVIVAGAFVNQRYQEADGDKTHACMLIVPGPNGGPITKQATAERHLKPMKPELYTVGDIYSQRADEIHESIPADGTVTLNDRTRTGGEDRARVFWPIGTEWVDAKPRVAKPEEVRDVCLDSIRRWFR